jgi:hypothetical protein
VTHKDNEPYAKAWFESKDLKCAYHIDHWFNLTGTNRYRTANKAVIIGLPYKPMFVYHALSLYKASEEIAYGDNGNAVRSNLRQTGMAADVIQAIARIRLRNITDVNGGCLPAQIWITAGKSNKYKNGMFDTLLPAIEKKMPGITIKEIEIKGIDKPKKAKPTYADSIIQFITNSLKTVGDSISIYEPRDSLGLTAQAFRDSTKTKEFKTLLNLIGVEVVTEMIPGRRGRMKKAKLYKRVRPFDQYDMPADLL